MKLETRRLFVGNLPLESTEKEIRKKLNKHGQVQSVELRQRKDVDGNPVSAFAFVNLETDGAKLRNCLDAVCCKKWRSNAVKVEVAKESFISRLQKEISNSSDRTPSFPIPDKRSKDKFKVKFESSEYGDESEMVQSKRDHHEGTVSFLTDSETEESPKKLPKFAGTKTALNAQESEQSGERNFSNGTNKKGEKSILNKFESFSDIWQDSPVPCGQSDGRRGYKRKAESGEYHERNKRNRRHDYDVSVEENSFETTAKKGKKDQLKSLEEKQLLELQSPYANDSRFILDQRFADSEGDDDINNQDGKFMGQNWKTKEKWNKYDHPFRDTSMLKYDPDQAEHSKYEIKVEKKAATTEKKKQKKKKANTEEVEEEVNKPTASQEKFYSVSEMLISSFKNKNDGAETKGFSLLKKLGREHREDNNQENTEEKYEAKPLKLDFKLMGNPFQYVSSDSENEKMEEQEVFPEVKEIQKDRRKQGKGRLDRRKQDIFRSAFFFEENDTRLQEGWNFFSEDRDLAEITENFPQVQEELRNIVKRKTMHLRQRNRPNRFKFRSAPQRKS